jgi:DNA-binding GntR family transcriptional regulator
MRTSGVKNETTQNKRYLIFNQLRDEIIHGEYPGGTFFSENELCEKFGVSRTPVREALIKLANAHYIEMIPNRGAFVPKITLDDIVELCELHIANDGMAFYLACSRASPELIAAMEGSVKKQTDMMERGGFRPIEISTEDANFHHMIINNCGNNRLIRVIDDVQNQMARITQLSADEVAVVETLRVSLGYHVKIIDAFKRKAPEASRALIQDHWDDMKRGYIRRSINGMLSSRL